MPEIKLISVTPEAEKTIMFCARVSSSDQNSTNTKLLNYCIKHGHWSVFEMADMCVEIKTSRAIAAQILRHKSFVFQEFSQRYAEVQGFETYNPRRQDTKNRQNSIDDLPQEAKDWFKLMQQHVQMEGEFAYRLALDKGIAKECARFLLPLSTSTTMYMKGSLRSWLHYLDVRTDPSTQLEHREIAEEIQKIFVEQFPIIAEAKGWKK
jgi:thymidylate synthase (FAD)